MALAGWPLAHGLAMTLVERTEEQETVSDDGYRRIRTDIVFGRLRPGQKLRLEGLKEDYGVSVSTLREILNRLAAEGFVLAEGRRGFEVAPISVENLRELAELRLLLEQHAMQCRSSRSVFSPPLTRAAAFPIRISSMYDIA